MQTHLAILAHDEGNAPLGSGPIFQAAAGVGVRILHLEDDARDADLVANSLRKNDFECTIRWVMDRASFEQELQSTSFDVILSDYAVPGFRGMEALHMAREAAPDTPFIFLSGMIGEERAIEAVRFGATDYVIKDRLAQLPAVLRRACREAKAWRKVREQSELLERAEDAIFVRDMQQRVTYWSRGAEKVYGWSPLEMAGKKASELLYRQGAPAREDAWRIVLEKGEWIGELRQVTKDGRDIVVTSRRTLLRNSQGRPVAVLNINTDVTERKELEKHLLRRERVESIGALASGISHDLNNVLAPILIALELLESEIRDEENRRMLQIAKSSAKRGAQLVQRIVQFARGADARESRLDLAALVREMAELARTTFPPRIQIYCQAERDLFPVYGDATQVHQLLLNLCLNARDAMKQGGTLTLKVSNALLQGRVFRAHREPISGPYVQIEVADTGHGIPEQLVDRVFEPFFTTKADAGGMGLGLAVVSTIVRNHQGLLDVASAEGGGAVFRVYLPAAPSDARPISRSHLAAGWRSQNRRVLIVDGELAVLEMTRSLLEAHDFSVFTARNGTEAIAALQNPEAAIQAVLTDLTSPHEEGIELCKTIKALAPEAKVICVAGPSGMDASGGLEPACAADAILDKACAPVELLNVLNTLLPAPRPA